MLIVDELDKWVGNDAAAHPEETEIEMADRKQSGVASGAPDDVGDEGEEMFDRWKCVICGCTDDHACEGGCYWVYPNLCSACAEKLTGVNTKRWMYPVSVGCGDTLIIECSYHLNLAGMGKAEKMIRDAIADQKDKQPGLLILGEGFRLVGIISGCDNRQQREGPRDE